MHIPSLTPRCKPIIKLYREGHTLYLICGQNESSFVKHGQFHGSLQDDQVVCLTTFLFQYRTTVSLPKNDTFFFKIKCH